MQDDAWAINNVLATNFLIPWANLLEWIQEWYEIQEKAYKELYEGTF